MKHTQINKEYYDVYFTDAKYIKRINLDSSFQKYRVSKVMQIYTPKKNERVLDLGCAWGTFCFAIAPFCKDVTGVDYNQKGIELCNRLLDISKFNNIKFICSDAQHTELESESYDVIICADLFEHLYPDIFENVMDECYRLLRNGGKLVIWTPNSGHILELLKKHNIIIKRFEGHVDYKSLERLLNSLVKRHFVIKKSYYDESHIPILRSFERFSMDFLPIMRRRIAILAEKKIFRNH